ncbi:MAG: hypothetical protein ACYCV1_13525 [Acidimicrobiales bacterium]
MSGPEILARAEALLDAEMVAKALKAIEDELPVGVRPHQLRVRSLLLGMLLAVADGRPAHLTRVHEALVSLPEADRRRLGVSVEWKAGPHTLTYRQSEYTARLALAVLAKDDPDGQPTDALQQLSDALINTGVTATGVPMSSSLAVDWIDIESFSTRRTKPDGNYADKEAAWGHRKGGGPGEKDQLFFGYYLSLATMVEDEGSGEVPELVRRMNLVGCDHDPVPAMTDVLVSMAESGTPIGDVVVDSGYAHRIPAHFALPLRAKGAQLVMWTCTLTIGAHRAPSVVPWHSTGTSPAPPRRNPSSTWGRLPGGPEGRRSPPTTADATSSRATSPAGSAPTTPTATTGSAAQPH